MATFDFQFGGNIAKFNAALNNMKSQVKGVVAPINGILSTIGVGISFSFINGLIEKFSAMNSQAKTLGFTVEEFQDLANVFKLLGANSDQAFDALRQLTSNIGQAQTGTGELVNTIKMLGISLTDREGEFKTTKEFLLDLADATSKLTTVEQQNSIAKKAFGETGTIYVQALREGREGMQAFLDKASEMAKITIEEGEALQQAGIMIREYYDSAMVMGAKALVWTGNIDRKVKEKEMSILKSMASIFTKSSAASQAHYAGLKKSVEEYGGEQDKAVDGEQNLANTLSKTNDIIAKSSLNYIELGDEIVDLEVRKLSAIDKVSDALNDFFGPLDEIADKEHKSLLIAQNKAAYYESIKNLAKAIVVNIQEENQALQSAAIAARGVADAARNSSDEIRYNAEYAAQLATNLWLGVDALEAQSRAAQEAAAAINNGSMAGAGGLQGDIGALSTEAIIYAIDQIESWISGTRRNSPNTITGDTIQSAQVQAYKEQIQTLKDELRMRQDVAKYAQQWGEAAAVIYARERYGLTPAAVEEIIRDAADTINQSNTAIQSGVRDAINQSADAIRSTTVIGQKMNQITADQLTNF